MMGSVRAAVFAAVLSIAFWGAASAQTLQPTWPGANGEVSLAPGFTPDPHTVTFNAGGPVDAAGARLGANCLGAIAARPNVSLTFPASTAPLYISATAGADTTLVVRAPDGSYHCDDDSAGDLNPVVTFETPAAGRYQIWVGTYAHNGQAPEAILHISEIGFGPGPDPSIMPDRALAPAHGNAALAGGFAPRTVELEAGGEIFARALRRPGCWGAIGRAPDYRVSYTPGRTASPLVFAADSQADTTLVVAAPNGQYFCNDDRAETDVNPLVTFAAPAAGEYNVWVGTFSEGPPRPATLSISERPAP